MYPQYMPATEHHLGEGDWVGAGGRPEKRSVDHAGNSQGVRQLLSVAETEGDASFWKDA